MNNFSLKLIGLIIALLFIQSKVKFDVIVPHRPINFENCIVGKIESKKTDSKVTTIGNNYDVHLKLKIRYKAGECNYFTLKEFILKPEVTFPNKVFKNYYQFYFPALFTASSPLRVPPSRV